MLPFMELSYFWYSRQKTVIERVSTENTSVWLNCGTAVCPAANYL